MTRQEEYPVYFFPNSNLELLDYKSGAMADILRY